MWVFAKKKLYDILNYTTTGFRYFNIYYVEIGETLLKKYFDTMGFID